MADPKPLPAGQLELAGKVYMQDARGSMVPLELVKPEHKLQDETVRQIFAGAEAMSFQLAQFVCHARERVDEFLTLITQEYGAKARPGGDKGNMTLQTYDGLLRVQVQVADLIRFDSAALNACKLLVEECIAEWSADSQAELRAIVMNAFRLDKAGQINRGSLLGLLRLDIQDERWLRAMKALRDAIQVDGTKSYLRFHKRENPKAPWRNVTLDAAQV
jgi:hypothetical protein